MLSLPYRCTEESTRFGSPQMVWLLFPPSPLPRWKALTIKAFLSFSVCDKESTHLLVTSWLTSIYVPTAPKVVTSWQHSMSWEWTRFSVSCLMKGDHGRQLVAPLSCVLMLEACCPNPNRTKKQVLLSGATRPSLLSIAAAAQAAVSVNLSVCVEPLRVHLAP